jgi:hypothetical protein
MIERRDVCDVPGAREFPRRHIRIVPDLADNPDLCPHHL